MPIFDRYIAVDWSAHNGPKTGRDSIWIGEATAAGLLPSRNPATRAAAMADIESTLLAARTRGERVMVGFDFVFGFPAGAAEAIAQAATPLPASPTRGEVPIVVVAPPWPHSPADPLPLVGRAGEGGATRSDLSTTVEGIRLDASDTSPLVGEAGRGVATRSNVSAPWSRLWSTLHTLITDTEQNVSNRFDVAAEINRITAPRFWGHPHGRRYAHLRPTRAAADYTTIAERRAVESRIRGPQPVWKLTGVGAVGSQTLLGIPRLEALRRHPVLGRDTAVWPFDTGFSDNLSAPITLVEIYPSSFPIDIAAEPKDRAQVETCVRRYAALDGAGLLETFLSAPADIGPANLAAAIAEEGWIAGVGHDHLCLLLPVAA